MKQRTRIYYSEKQKSLMWDRWEKAILYTQSPDFLIDIIHLLLAYSPEQVAYAHQKESAQA